MFKIIIIVLFTFNLHSVWHSRYNPPKEGQLFMYLGRETDGYFGSKLLILTHYNPDFKNSIPISGWYDVDRRSIHYWMKKGYTIYVLPRKYRTDKQKNGEWDG